MGLNEGTTKAPLENQDSSSSVDMQFFFFQYLVNVHRFDSNKFIFQGYFFILVILLLTNQNMKFGNVTFLDSQSQVCSFTFVQIFSH